MAVFISGGSFVHSSLSDIFSENSWEEIITACQMNNIPSTWAVGNYKNMTINGVEYRIDIIGKDHDLYSDGTGKAPLTFQLHDCYATDYSMNSSHTNSGGWGACAMRNTHLPAILATMPSEVQTGIRAVNKLSAINSVINTTSDKLFLLSEVEIFNVASFSYTGEGNQYAYYAEGHGTVKYQSGTSKTWLERSLFANNADSFCSVNLDGTAGSLGAAYARGVSFAFCF